MVYDGLLPPCFFFILVRHEGEDKIWSKMLLFVLIRCFNMLWGFLPLPPPARPWGPLEIAGAQLCTRQVWVCCCCQVGTQVTRDGLEIGQGGDFHREVSYKLRVPQVLGGQVWGPKPSWAWSSGHCPKTQLGNVKEACLQEELHNEASLGKSHVISTRAEHL